MKKLRERLRNIGKWEVAEFMAAPLDWLDPFHTEFRDIQAAQTYRARRVRRRRRSRRRRRNGQAPLVMTWNIKFAGGRVDFWFDGHGSRVILRDWEVLAHLEGLAAKINQVDPDILLVQEVDVDSKRAAHIDQMQWLLDHTGLNFGAYASQWRADYVPRKGLGKVDMGIGILSRYPIVDAQRLSLPAMGSQDRLTRYFYLKRAVLTARVRLPKAGDLHVVNTHTEAFATGDIKRRQIGLFQAELDRLDRAKATFVAGGDLNTLPPGTGRRHGFDDVFDGRGAPGFEASDYRGDEGCLDGLYGRYQPAVSPDEYSADNKPHFTHSTSADHFWSRKLDYLFTNATFKEGSAVTHQDEDAGGMATMMLSDHAPLSAQVAT